MNDGLKRAAMVMGVAAMMAGIPASAHHSFAMFDQRKIMTLTGTVHEFQWTNPHAFIELAAAGGAHWSIELNSPNNLKRQGWNRVSLKAGDKVTVRINPLRDGHPGGLFLDVKLADGRTLDSGLPKDGTPINVPRL